MTMRDDMQSRGGMESPRVENPDQNRSGDQMARDEAAIREVFDQYSSFIMAHDADRWMELWDDAGVQLAPGTPMNVGKGEIRKANYDFFKDASRSWVFRVHTQEVLLCGGDFAVARGCYDYVATPNDGTAPMTMDGKFMSVFKRQSDGRWLLYRDCFNSNG